MSQKEKNSKETPQNNRNIEPDAQQAEVPAKQETLKEAAPAKEAAKAKEAAPAKEAAKAKEAAPAKQSASAKKQESAKKSMSAKEKEKYEETIAGMQASVEESRGKLALANDKYLRLQAEFDNYRKRTARERMDLILTAGEDMIKGILPVLDDCERALQVMSQTEGNEAAKEGVELIYRKLFKYLESKGLKVIEAQGLALDTDKHAAVAQMPAPSEELKNKIIEVALKGYTLNGKVIRFANVVVGM